MTELNDSTLPPAATELPRKRGRPRKYPLLPEEPPRTRRRVKLRAVQKLFYNNRIVEENEVYWFLGDPLPSEEVAIPVDPATPLGVGPPVLAPLGGHKESPPWTTKGFVDQANRRAGRNEDEFED